MMGGGAFILLKAGRNRPESAKQAEIRLAGLLKILGIPPGQGAKALAKGRKKWCDGCPGADFRRIWLICRYRPFCNLDHSFSLEIGAVSRQRAQGKDEASIDS
jgi:hypothetical protein